MPKTRKIAWRIEHKESGYGPYTIYRASLDIANEINGEHCIVFNPYPVHFKDGMVCGFRSRRRFVLLTKKEGLTTGPSWFSSVPQNDSETTSRRENLLQKLDKHGFVIRVYEYTEGVYGAWCQVAFRKETARIIAEFSIIDAYCNPRIQF